MATSLDRVEWAERNTFNGLYDRMDADAKLAYLDKYTLKNADGDIIPGTISVTMNDPAVFLNTVVSWIMSARWQTVVEGTSNKQQRTIERFIDDRNAEADALLSKTGYSRELHFLASHINARGWIGERRLWGPDKAGKVKLEVTPVDMRYCSYERYGEDYDWVANRFRRPRSVIEKQYGITFHGNDEEVEGLDYWDGEKEEVWIDGKIVPSSQGRPMPNKHKIGYPPFVVVEAPEGFMLLDKGYMVHKGESVFFLNRELYASYNRLMSIDMSLAMLTVAPPYQRSTLDKKPSDYPELGTVIDLNPGNPPEEYKLVPQSDINMANRISQQGVGGALQKGGLHDFYLLESQQQETATLITTQTEIRDKILEPRKQALITFKVLADRMDIDQINKGKYSVEVGRTGVRRTYTYQELGDNNYSIDYEFMSRSKKQEIANMALFRAAKDAGMSLESCLRDVLMLDDPQAEMDRIESEKAEQADPVLFFMRKARALAREAAELSGVEADAKKLESIRLTRKGIEMLQQIGVQQQGTPQAQTQPTGNNSLVPLMAGGNMGGL